MVILDINGWQKKVIDEPLSATLKGYIEVDIMPPISGLVPSLGKGPGPDDTFRTVLLRYKGRRVDGIKVFEV